MLKKLKPTIAIIDSGIGGVSILNQLIAKFKFGNYIYFADNLFMPYGNKTAKFIRNRIDDIVEYLNKSFKPDYIILACNTASSVINKPDYQNVLTLSFNKAAPILATQLTAKQLAGFDVIADKNLASMIEKYIENNSKLAQIIKKHIKRLDLANCKLITLGCTHYELVEPLFKKICPNTTFICNSRTLMEKINFEPNQKLKTIKVLLSKKDERYEHLIYSLINTKGD